MLNYMRSWVQSTPGLVAKNSVYLTMSLGATYLLGFVVAMVLTRYLGPSGYGDLTLAYAYCGLFIPLAEAGLNLTLVREASQKPDQVGNLIGNGITLRFTLAAVASILALLILPLWDYGPTTTRLCQLCIFLILISPVNLFRVIFLVTLQIKHVAVLDAISQLLNAALILGVILVWQGNTTQIVLAYLAASFIGQGLYAVYGWRLSPQRISFRIDPGLWKMLLARTWPLAVVAALSAVQLHGGRLIVGRVLSSAQGGLYAVAISWATALPFVASVFFSSVYPLMSRAYASDRQRFQWLCRFSFQVMMAFILPIALFVSLTSTEILALYAGAAYGQAAPLLTVLMWVEVLQFQGFVLYYIVLSIGRQSILAWMATLLTIIQLGILIVLLPRLGIIGAGLAMLLTRMVATGIYALLHVTRPFIHDWLHGSVQPLVALGLTAVALLILQPTGLLVWVIGCVTYGLAWGLLVGYRLRGPYLISQALKRVGLR